MPKIKWGYIRGIGYRSIVLLTDEFEMKAAKELANKLEITIDDSTYAIGQIKSRQRAEHIQHAVNRRANQLRAQAEHNHAITA